MVLAIGGKFSTHPNRRRLASGKTCQGVCIVTSDVTTGRDVDHRLPASALYAPSWLDRLVAWIQRLPGPSWVFYLAAWLVLLTLDIAVNWQSIIGSDATRLPDILRFHVMFSGFGLCTLALRQFLTVTARSTLGDFRPALTVTDDEYALLEFQLTVAPARQTLIASVFGVVLAVALAVTSPYELTTMKLGTSLLAKVVDTAIYCFQWLVTAGLSYHVIRQLVFINRIYTRYSQIDIFRLGPFYAFSRLTARTAAAFAFMNFAWAVNDPLGTSFSLLGLLTDLVFALVAVAIFALPLYSIHRLLENEKQDLLGEVGQRIRATIVTLHQGVDTGEMALIDQSQRIMASLIQEKGLLSAISTWPWQVDAIRLVATAVLLPVIISILGQVLKRWVGP
jgi:hypothetical protein